MARVPFKLKSSPVKGALSDFFKTITKKATPETKVKRAELKSRAKKSGVSTFEQSKIDRTAKYRADIKETKRRENDPLLEEIKDTSELKVGEGIVEGPKEKPKTKSKVDWSKAPKLNTQARRDWYTTNNLAQDSTTVLKKKSPAKIYSKPKGKRTVY